VKELAASLRPRNVFSDGLENLRINLIPRLIHNSKVATDNYRSGIPLQVRDALFYEQLMQGVVVSQPYQQSTGCSFRNEFQVPERASVLFLPNKFDAPVNCGKLAANRGRAVHRSIIGNQKLVIGKGLRQH